MNLLIERLRRLAAGNPPVARWVLGLLIAAAIAAFLWMGRDTDQRPSTPTAADTPSVEDVSSPVDAGNDPPPPPDAAGQSGDIIPPEEP